MNGLETYGQGRFAHVPQPLSDDELERFRHDCKVTGFWVGHTDSDTLDGLRRLLATIDALKNSYDALDEEFSEFVRSERG